MEEDIISNTIYTYKKLKAEFTKNKLINELINNKLTYKDLQNKYKYNERLFSKLAKEYNIPKNFNNIRINANKYHIKHFDIIQIILLYQEDMLSLRKISEIFECNRWTIKKVLIDNDIKIRNGHEKIYYKNRRRQIDYTYKHIDSNGYILIGNEREHRLVMEKFLHRKLTTNETVHHINLDKINNDINNLFLFPSNNSHASYHQYIKYKTYIEPQYFLDNIYSLLIQTLFNYDWLYNQYIKLNKSIKTISNEIDSSRVAIKNQLDITKIYLLRTPTINQYI